ncbi:MAG TPA: PAS domain S-box protein [Anaerolineales bacterium]|nr:PAS domain S-box protein [Anaerolineales bacterium]
MSQLSGDHSTSEEEYRNIFEAASDGLVIYDIETDAVVEANPAACEMHGYTRQEFIGLNPAVFMLPESHVLFREQVRTAEPGIVFEASLVHLRKDGSVFYVEVRRSMILYRDRPSLLSVIRDVSQRIQTEKILSRQLDAQMHEQTTLLAISHTLASTLEFQPGLILEQLRQIIEYSHAGLFALEDSMLVTLVMRGTPQLEGSPPFRIQLRGPETVAALFNKHQPIRIADVASDSPKARFLRGLLEEGTFALIEGMHSWMWVPLAVKGRVMGGVGVAHEKRNYFTSHHADLALSVADQAAITLVNAELNKQAQEVAVLEERQRLAHNLHDAINQSLFSAGLIAEVLPRLWDRDQGEARRSLEDLRKLTRGAMAEMRALLAELRPSTLTDAELGDLLRLLGNAFTGRTNIPAKVTVVGQASLPAEVQVAIYRICQEALNNVAKHARASLVEIQLTHHDSAIELTIRDDGQGFDPEQTASGHYGLSMMQERAEGVGAQLSITSQPSRGTELLIRWVQTPPAQKVLREENL